MTTRYTEKQIEDVARILKSDAGHLDCVRNTIIQEFADLFAADNPNPDECLFCGETRGPDPLCFSRDTPDTGHVYDGGFNREQFLEACGLESEG